MNIAPKTMRSQAHAGYAGQRRGVPRSNHPNRRQFLRAGALAACAVSLPKPLRAETTGERKPRARSAILVYLGGGLSHIDSFDLKPGAPAEIRGEYRPISTRVPGLLVGELLPNLARCIDKLTLVRSASHDCNHHETATNWVLSGRFGSPFGEFPAMGAVAAQQLGCQGLLPPYVAVPRNPSCTWELGRSAFLGDRYESFQTGNLSLGDERRSAFDEFQPRAAAMALSGEARQAFAIDREKAATRDRYGRGTFGQNCLLARRLVERGVRFVTVSLGGWDHHAKIGIGLGRMLPRFDLGFSALIEDLHVRGLLDETLVLACGEFGRSPKMNADAGRDHWPAAASLVFAGAGAPPGQVIGKTDPHGAYVIGRPVSPADVARTVYHALGIDPSRQLVTPDGRRLAILAEETP